MPYLNRKRIDEKVGQHRLVVSSDKIDEINNKAMSYATILKEMEI